MEDLKPNKREKANVFSFITFWWMNSVFAKGEKKTLVETDLFKLSKSDSSEYLCGKLERNWGKQLEKIKRGGKPSLVRAIMKTYGLRFFGTGLFCTFEEGLRISTPFLLARLIRYFENMDTTPISEAYVTAAMISSIAFFLAVYRHGYMYFMQRVGWHIRAASCALMYKKTLRLSQKALGQTTTGKIVNLTATDVMKFDQLPLFIHFFWLGPLEAGLCIYLLWEPIGPAVLCGIGLLFVVMSIQSLNGRLFGKLRMKTAVVTDERIRLMNEVITGIRIIKMYTWEKPFSALVQTLRKKEIRRVMATGMIRAFNLSMFMTLPRIMTCITFIVYVATGREISASQVFVVIGMFNIIRVSLGLYFPLAIEKIAESRISIKRIQSFLLLDEIGGVRTKIETKINLSGTKKNGRRKENSPNFNAEKLDPNESFVEMKGYCGRWFTANEEAEADKSLTLKNVNIKVESGKLLAVIGPVGAGKSSLLSAILGEMPMLSGEVNVNGKVTFANQVPWVFAGTVRENILFGQEFDEDWYKKVVHACGLERDLELLTDGDMTLVGARGVTLSGGQKARVNLARAAYRKEATICLLDDPLSAVDAAVGKHLFKHCISGLMKDKARILVTHQLQLLQDADEIMILKEGEIVSRGTYNELQADGTDFASLLQERDDSDEEDDEVVDETAVLIKQPRKSSSASKLSLSKHSLNSYVSSDVQEETKSLLEEEVQIVEKLDKDTGHSPREEMREQGTVGRGVYMEYFRCGAGKLLGFCFVIMILLSHITLIACEWWIALWASRYERYKSSVVNGSEEATFMNSTNLTANSSGNHSLATVLDEGNHSMNFTTAQGDYFTTTISPEGTFDTNFYLITYAVLIAVTIVCVLTRVVIHFYICVSSGIQMHNKMFRSILRVPVRFFDTNPSGQILNRFSKDIGQIDDLLPYTFHDFLMITGVILAMLIMVVTINYLVIIVVIPLLIAFVWLRQYYLKTTRDIKRLEGATRSPVFSLLSSTLEGLSTVRAFRVQNEFEEKFHERQDLHSSAWFMFLCAGKWLGIRLDLLNAVFVTTISLSSLATLSIIPIESGQVGLILLYSINLIGLFQWGVRQSAEVENLMTSVERVQQYYKIPPEALDEIPEKKPPADWPTQGSLTFDRVSFAYYEGGPTVLNTIEVKIRAKEKVGIVGRTGAGKSSLISALFRLSELTGGEIMIDGVPITPLGLNDLRSALSIIPQDPMLFSGSMRKNLDPFSRYSDEDLWDALEQVQLRDVVDSLPSKLGTELAESGSNFSVGQRQLVCLARAVLRKSKILVIDEATANVDLRTDRLIQLTIREKFKDCTVLTIAHRINTIIDSDRVLVLDAGCVKDFNDPYVLLQNPESSFSKMVNVANSNEAESLKKMVEEAYKARNKTKA